MCYYSGVIIVTIPENSKDLFPVQQETPPRCRQRIGLQAMPRALQKTCRNRHVFSYVKEISLASISLGCSLSTRCFWQYNHLLLQQHSFVTGEAENFPSLLEVWALDET